MASLALRSIVVAAVALAAAPAAAEEAQPAAVAPPPAPVAAPLTGAPPAAPPIAAPQPWAYPYPYAPPPPVWYPPRPAAPVTVQRSTVAVVLGSILLPVGVGMAAGGAAELHDGVQTCTLEAGAGYHCTKPGIDAGTIAITVTGLAAMIGGLVLVVYGAGRVPVGSEPATARALPAWAGAPAASGWRWSF